MSDLAFALVMVFIVIPAGVFTIFWFVDQFFKDDRKDD